MYSPDLAAVRPRLVLIAASLLALLPLPSLASPSLVAESISLDQTVVDCQSGVTTGTASVTVANHGTTNTGVDVTVLVFEDRDGDGNWTPGVDSELGHHVIVGGLARAGAAAPAVWATTVAVPLSGSVTFRDRPLHAVVDPDDVIAELDESDNVRVSCETRPHLALPAEDAFEMRVKMHLLTGINVVSTPMIGHITDDNGDGIHGPGDIPDIVLLPNDDFPGPYHVFSGDDGRTHFLTAADLPMAGPPALGDIDGDGRPEIVGAHADHLRLVAFNHDGSVRWISAPSSLRGDHGAPAIADLDGNGQVEVVFGAKVFDGRTGVLLADGWVDYTNRERKGWNRNGFGRFSTALGDIDGDGLMEIVAGPGYFRWDGGLITFHQGSATPRDGFTALGQLDDDADAEILTTYDGNLWQFDHLGVLDPSWPHGSDGLRLSSDLGDAGALGGWPFIADLRPEAAGEPAAAEHGLQGSHPAYPLDAEWRKGQDRAHGEARLSDHAAGVPARVS